MKEKDGPRSIKQKVVSLDNYEPLSEIPENKFKSFIFLPFNEYWGVFLSFTILTNFVQCVFWLTFRSRDSIKAELHYYTCELIFMVTTIAIIMHRKMRKYRRSRYHTKKSVSVIVLCLITVLPIYEIYYLMSAFKWQTKISSGLEQMMTYSNMKSGIRIIYALIFFFEKRSQVGIDNLFYVLYNHIFNVACITAISTCVWYSRAAYGDENNWIQQLDVYVFNRSLSSEWMVISYHTNIAFFTRNNDGTVYGVNNGEKITILVITTMGFVYQNIILCAELIATFLRKQKHRFVFTLRLQKILHLLNDWRVERDVRRRTIDYYRIYWERRFGINSFPPAFKLLPFALRKEITVDIFWDAFRHSKLLTNTDTSFKRSLSLHMKNEFLLPGDFLYVAGEAKHKMVYILSGVVQLLSEEDNESPLLSLSAGTLLGEVSCLGIYKSRVNVRCDTYCEVQSLDIISFYGVLLEYRAVTHQLLQAVETRISYAKWATSEITPKVDLTIEDYVPLTTIKTLKNQWKYLMMLHRNKNSDKAIWKRLDKSFTSNYLDTLVICESQESDEHKICLRDSCPMVMRPEASFRIFLEYLVFFTVCIEMTLMPYPIFFLREVPYAITNILVILDLVYYLDIYLQLSTAVKVSPEVTFTKPSDIVAYKFKQIGFYVDLIAAFPIASSLHIMGIDSLTTAKAQSIRLLKIKKLFNYVNVMETKLNLHSFTVHTAKYLVLALVACYLISCLLYMVSCYYPTCTKNGWFEYNARNKTNPNKDLFVKTYYFAMSLFLNYHVSDNVLIIIPDLLMHLAITFVGYTVYCFMFSELTASGVMIYRESLEHHDEIAMFNVIMKRRNVDINLKTKLVNILEFNWNFNQGAVVQGKDGILEDASSKIKAELITNRFIACLRLVPLFKDCPESILKKFTLNANAVTLPPKTCVQNVDVMPHNIYIVLRGFCQMNSKLPGDAERDAKIILKRGDMLAVVETLHRIKMFGAITTVTAAELLVIPYDLFVDVFRLYRTDFAYMQNALKEHMRQFESILLRKGCRLPEMRAPAPALGAVDTFDFQVYMEEKSKSYVRNEYMRSFIALGTWKWIRFFLLKRTINPTGGAYRSYEMFRYTFIVIEFFIGLVSLSVFHAYLRYVQLFMLAGHIFGAVDQYVRLHCRYYNENGILVTHPLYTAYNYLSTSFVIDVFANLPLNVFNFAEMFQRNKHETELFLELCLKCLALYRPYQGLTYIQNRSSSSVAVFIIRAKLCLALSVILGLITNLLMVLSCEFDGQITNCNSGKFRLRSIFKTFSTPAQVFVQCMYLCVTTYSHAIIGVFELEVTDEVIWFLLFVITVYVTRSVICSIFTSSKIGGNVNLSIHQARMRQFLSFAKEVMLDDTVTKEMVDHYEHVWKETLGTDINVISEKFNLYLRTQFVCFLYETTLRKTKIFANAPSAIIQRLVLYLQEVHFKKGAQIIRCNDVQGMLYVVHKGVVDVRVADTSIAALAEGGLFGCFQRCGSTRQTITAVGNTHTILLTLDSTKLHDILSEWTESATEGILREIKLLNTEFMETKELQSTEYISKGHHQSVLLVSKAKLPSLKNVSLSNSSAYDRVIKIFNTYLNADSFWYWLYDYTTNVHLSAWVSMWILAYAFIDARSPPEFTFFFMLYLFDLVYVSKVLFGFHLAYVDDNTGIKILEARLIAKRYVKKDFLFNVVSCLPLELIGMYVAPEWIKLFTLNRALRFFYLSKYYKICKNRLMVSKHLRWSFLIYSTVFQVQVMASVWFSVACFAPRCYHTVEVTGRPRTVKLANSTMQSALLGYTYVVNIFAKGGLRDMIPVTTLQLLVSVVIALYSQAAMANLTSSVANIIIIQNNTMYNYDYEINRVKLYLQGRLLSPAILRKVWEYLLQLWRFQQGEWLPRLIISAPSYLKQDVMLYLYGYHLENHFLFAKTHRDFLRQVVAELDRRVYLPGNVIVEKGDVDRTMYFVHSGEVGAYDRHGNNEIQCFILRNEMSFGEAQGMYGTPFQVCYRALTIVTVLALQKSSWDYLLRWFPASNEEIKAKAQEYGLKTAFSYFHSHQTV